MKANKDDACSPFDVACLGMVILVLIFGAMAFVSVIISAASPLIKCHDKTMSGCLDHIDCVWCSRPEGQACYYRSEVALRCDGVNVTVVHPERERERLDLQLTSQSYWRGIAVMSLISTFTVVIGAIILLCSIHSINRTDKTD